MTMSKDIKSVLNIQYWPNSFRVTGHLCGEFTGLRWIPSTKASDAGVDVFFDLRPDKQLSKQS